jgi:hypothetical protein
MNGKKPKKKTCKPEGGSQTRKRDRRFPDATTIA